MGAGLWQTGWKRVNGVRPLNMDCLITCEGLTRRKLPFIATLYIKTRIALSAIGHVCMYYVTRRAKVKTKDRQLETCALLINCSLDLTSYCLLLLRLRR
jgi:hypothetical protein